MMMQKIKKIALVCATWIGVLNATPAIWDGSADISWYEPGAQAYNLTTAEQLAGLAKLVNEGTSDFDGKTIALGFDIFLNDTAGIGDTSWYNISHTEWTPIGTKKNPFRGEFDALAGKNNRKIFGLYIKNGNDYAGFFGYTEHLKVSNLDLVAGSITAQNYVGAVAGYAINAIITNVHSKVNVSGANCVGGLVGFSTGKLNASSVESRVLGIDSVGGVAGYVDEIESSVHDKGYVQGRNYVGGIAGASAVISGSHHEGGDVVGLGSYIGGVVGQCSSVNNSFAESSVRGVSYVGGIAGISEEIKNVHHCVGNVIGGGHYVGGIAGFSNSIYTSYAEGDVIGDSSYVGGVVGSAKGLLSTVYHTGGNITGRAYIGGLAGNTNRIHLSYSEGNVVGEDNFVGGLAGYARGTIDSSHSKGNVNGTEYVGGSVGFSKGLLNGVYHIGGDITGHAYVGGLVGNANRIRSSYSEGNVVGEDNFVGGLAGYASGTIDSSYSEGNVGGIDYVGGLVGFALASITESYSKGNVSGLNNFIGGLVGQSSGTIFNSHSLGNVEGENYIGGLVGHSYFYSKTDRDTIVHVVRNSYAIGDIRGQNYVGGLVGLDSIYNGDSTTVDTITTLSLITKVMYNSYSKGTVTAEGNYVGGVLGKSNYNYGVKNSFLLMESVHHMDGSINGISYVGGLAGQLTGSITNSFSEGSVIGECDYVGGLVGLNFYAFQSDGNAVSTHESRKIKVLQNSYATGDVYGKNFVGGLVGTDYFYADTILYKQISNTPIRIIYKSHFKGRVVGKHDYVGGLLGRTDYPDEEHYSMHIDSSFHIEGHIEGMGFVGGVAGLLFGEIENSYSKGNVSGVTDYVGGVVGYASYVVDCFSESDVMGGNYVGGAVGFISSKTKNGAGYLRNTHSSGLVVGSGDYVGGVAGKALIGSISPIDSIYHINGDVKGASYVGGLVGHASYLKNSYSKGNVYGRGNYVGGIAGYTGTIRMSNSIGDVKGSGEYVGGVAGYAVTKIDSSSHIGGDITGEKLVGGLAGYAREVTNSSSEGNVFASGDVVGGIAGNSRIINNVCHKQGNVVGVNNVGGIVGKGGSIENSFFIGNAFGKDSVGGVAGSAESDIFKSYFIGDSVIGIYQVGGLVGVVNGRVDSSYSTANVKGDDNVGGLIGSSYGNISCSYATGNVIGDVDNSSAGNDNLGGLVGYAYKGSISKSLAIGDVSGTTKLGGLVGRFDGTSISQSYAQGNVTGSYYGNPADEVGNFYIGGLIGYGKGSVSETYVSGSVKGIEDGPVYTGCIVGYVNGSMEIADSYFDSEKCNLTFEGKTGIATISNSPAQTTAAMQSSSTYGNWDFIDTWRIIGESYPRLSWFVGTLAEAIVETASLKDFVYDGKEKKPAVKSITLYGTALYEGTDYTVSYQNNVNAGTAIINICGIGTYSGCKPVSFEISPVNVAVSIAAIDNQVYNGDSITPNISVLVADTVINPIDYRLFYTNNINAGKGSVQAVLTGNYSGSAKADFIIEKAPSTILELPTAKDVYFGQTLADAIIDGGDANVDGSFIWSESNVIPDVVNKGYEITFVPADAQNHLTATAIIPLTVKRNVIVFTYGKDTLQVDTLLYGDLPQFDGDLPKKESAQYVYTFKGWSPEIVKVAGSASYKAVYDSTIRKYTISFYSEDSLLQSSEIEYGKMPVLKTSNPKKAMSTAYTYQFKGWFPTLVSVAGDAEYKAVFDSTIRMYQISFVNGRDTLQKDSIAYGDSPKYTGKTPTKASTKNYSYEFTGWSPKIEKVVGEAAYHAVFDSTKLAGIMDNQFANLEMSVSVISRNIQVSTAPVGSVYAIFDVQGSVLKNGYVESANFNIAVPQAGNYMIRIGNHVQRISVK